MQRRITHPPQTAEPTIEEIIGQLSALYAIVPHGMMRNATRVLLRVAREFKAQQAATPQTTPPQITDGGKNGPIRIVWEGVIGKVGKYEYMLPRRLYSDGSVEEFYNNTWRPSSESHVGLVHLIARHLGVWQ